MATILYILLAIMVTTMFFAIIHLIFTMGRIFENSIMIRELDEKIDREMTEMEKIENEINILTEKLRGAE